MILTIALIIIGAATLYIACGVLAYGLTVAYFQQHYYSVRRASDSRSALLLAVTGPALLLVALVMGEFGYHGFQWRATDSAWVRDRSIPYESYLAEGHARKHRDSTL
jgi:hypothetical protein